MSIGRQLLRSLEHRQSRRTPAARARFEVIKRARHAFSVVAGDFPPTNLEGLARELGVVTIAYVPLSIDGRLVDTNGRFMIQIRESDPKVRQRFTLAHELGHLLVASAGVLVASTVRERSFAPVRPDRFEEELCNLAAAELLIPSEWISDFLAAKDPSFEPITHVAKLCQTSLEVAARRTVECSTWHSRLVWWERKTSEWCPIRAYPPYDTETLMNMRVSGEMSLLSRVARENRARTGDETIHIEGINQLFRASVWPSAKGQLAMLLLLDPRPVAAQPHKLF